MLKRDDLLRISQEHDLMPQLDDNGSPLPSPEVPRNAPHGLEVAKPLETAEPDRLKKHVSHQKSKSLPRLSAFKSRKKLDALASASSSVIVSGTHTAEPQIINNPPPSRERANCTSVPINDKKMHAYL